ncbi:chloramphenicol 3-O-phosphotransferase [Paenibacillus amylolyticus]|uniref:Chloramphenicol 3-O-phosphotransferase n=1 Tax=Paenibacillus amylolyticus TaxID=1451 RepID=A0AAP5LRM0_PAEAM|nr:AAA family ATPase [Paenibacillus amylolyticus]MDR6726723.1 chloramphenicol 3-O-phosphotransferase [Paenibacillus amylolyticus]
MIVMINGAFGAGKTSVANQLQPLIPNSMVFDPEEIGYMLRKVIPEDVRMKEEQTDDFQDMELWKILTVTIARELRQKYNKHLIVPMTVYNTERFEYIHGGLSELDSNLYHFTLMTSMETLHERIAKRGDKLGGWTYQQAVKCLEAFQDARFEQHIITDGLTTDDVVKHIYSNVMQKEPTLE